MHVNRAFGLPLFDLQSSPAQKTASAQNAADTIQRDVNQQNRIEQGLKSGELTTKEAGKLDRKEAKAAANGHVGVGEQQNIQSAENHQSKRIHREKHNERKRD